MRHHSTYSDIFPGLSRIILESGTHASREQLNALEATAWLAGEPHSNAPVSVAQSLRWLVARLNDHAPDAPRQRLKEALPYLIGTSTYGDETRRIDLIGQWAKRWGLPLEGGPANLQEAATRHRDSASQAETRAVRAAEHADAAATQLGADSVAAHAAAYEKAREAHTRSGEVSDAASIAARSLEKGIEARHRTDRDATTAGADAALARGVAGRATSAAKDEEALWSAIMDEAVALLRKLSQDDAPTGHAPVSQQ